MWGDTSHCSGGEEECRAYTLSWEGIQAPVGLWRTPRDGNSILYICPVPSVIPSAVIPDPPSSKDTSGVPFTQQAKCTTHKHALGKATG